MIRSSRMGENSIFLGPEKVQCDVDLSEIDCEKVKEEADYDMNT